MREAPRALPGSAARLERVRRGYHFHLPGVTYFVTMLFLAAGAINSQNYLLFWAFGLAVAGVVVSGILSGASLVGIEVAREAIVATRVGEDMRIRYHVTNRNRFFPAFAVTISELPERARKRDKRPTWPTLVDSPVAFVAHVGPRETVVAEAVVRAHARGEPRFQALAAWTTFPFGLTRKSVTFTLERVGIVRPARVPVPADIHRHLVRDTHEGSAGNRRSTEGDEFYGLRPYVPGDSLRSIAWKRSGHGAALLVRQYALPQTLRTWIVPVLSHGDAEANERVLALSAAVCELVSGRGRAVGLAEPAQHVLARPRPGRAHLEALLDAMARMSNNPPRAADEALPSTDWAQRSDAIMFVHPGAVPPASAVGERHVHISAANVHLPEKGRSP